MEFKDYYQILGVPREATAEGGGQHAAGSEAAEPHLHQRRVDRILATAVADLQELPLRDAVAEQALQPQPRRVRSDGAPQLSAQVCFVGEDERGQADEVREGGAGEGAQQLSDVAAGRCVGQREVLVHGGEEGAEEVADAQVELAVGEGGVKDEVGQSVAGGELPRGRVETADAHLNS